MKMYFISYSRERPQRAVLRRTLMDTGLNVWRDVESLDAGVPTTDGIEDQITPSTGAILWVNEAFLNSDYIRVIELPAFEVVRRRRSITIVPVFDGIHPTRDADHIDRVASWLREYNGVILDPDSEESPEGRVARRTVKTHTKAAAQTGNEPIVRMVSYDDTASRRDQAVLNLNWSEHMTGDSLDETTTENLRLALATATSALKSAYGATEIPILVKAHLGFAVALGHAFSQPTGCRPVVLTEDSIRWTTDADTQKQTLLLRDEKLTPGPASSRTAALEVSVSRDTSPGVDAYANLIQQPYRVRRRLTPPHGPGRTSLPGPEMAAAWARQIGNALIELNDQPHIDLTDLFLATPIQLAVLIGYWLNSAGPIRIMNWRGKTGPYEPLWTLP